MKRSALTTIPENLVKLLVQRNNFIPGSAWWAYLPVILVAVIGVLITLAAMMQSIRWEKNHAETAFREASQDRILVISREFSHTIGITQDIASFFEASEIVGRREFRKFVGPALKNQVSIKQLMWAPVIQNKDLSSFIDEARKSFPPYQVIEPGPAGEFIENHNRATYYPILYIQPYKSFKQSLGLNLGANPQVVDLLKEAELTRSAQTSSSITGLDESTDRAGIMVVVPVFFRNQEEDTQDEKLQTIRGFAIGIYYIGDIIERALKSLRSGGVDLYFYQNNSTAKEQLLYTHLSRLRKVQIPISEGGISQLIYRQQILIGTQQWEIVCKPAPEKFNIEIWNSWIILSGGIAFTILFSIYLATLVGRARRVRMEVKERTSQLQEAIQALHREVVERTSTEQKLQRLNETLEDSIAHRTAEAERKAQYLEQFAYVTSHDLKAPLRAVSNLAEWIEEDLQEKLDDASREQLALLRDRVRRMHDLIEGLLEYSRVGGGTDTQDLIDSSELVREIIDSLSPPAGFKIKIKGEMPTLYADRLQLGQVFSNLISNSIKHHGGNKGKIRITGSSHENYHEFSVCDDGQGIDPKYHNKIFQIFQTLESSDFETNTGIGLALVKKIVDEHGGAIRLESELGKGACFYFSWPKKPSSR